MKTAVIRIALATVALLTILAFGVALAQEGTNLIVVDSIVWGREGIHDEALTCAQTSRFFHGEQIVWRIKVVDPVTGAEMTDADLTSVEVMLVTGEVFEAEYGGHPPRDPVDEYWTTAWVVPDDFPTGVLDYSIEALANDGRMGELVVFPLTVSSLTIVAQ